MRLINNVDLKQLPPHLVGHSHWSRISDMKKKKTTVFVSGNFFVLHPGHVRLLKFAAEHGENLIIGVSALQPSYDVPTPEERAESLRELGIVSRVVVMKAGIEAFVRELRPDIIVKGREFEAVYNPEDKILKEYGGRLLFSSGESTYSANDLLGQDNTASQNIPKLPHDFMRRHGFDAANLIKTIADFKGLSIVVVGDLIIDEYINCEALGMSREDPTLVVSPRSVDRFVGGAGIVAGHAAALGASVKFLSVIGDDDVGRDAIKRLSEYKVDATLLTDDGRPTTLKQRYRVQDKTLLRVSRLRQNEISRSLQENVAVRFESACENAHLVIFSDFNYGVLPQALVDRMTAIARQSGTLIAADSQSSSQIGDISRFKQTVLMTPTEYEARLALRDQNGGLALVGLNLLKAARGENAFITLGAAGVLVVAAETAKREQQYDRLPSFNSLPRDVSGAGDSMLTAGAMALAAGATIWEAAFIGSLAAGIQTGQVGNRPILESALTSALQI